MRQTINDIVVNELQAELSDIDSYRMSVATGIESYIDPVLNDEELTKALQKVIDHYNTKISPSYQLDMFNDYGIAGGDDSFNFSEIQYANDDAYIGNIEVDMNQDIVEHTKEYYDTERNR
jgi:hypothetical protein